VCGWSWYLAVVHKVDNVDVFAVAHRLEQLDAQDFNEVPDQLPRKQSELRAGGARSLVHVAVDVVRGDFVQVHHNQLADSVSEVEGLARVAVTAVPVGVVFVAAMGQELVAEDVLHVRNALQPLLLRAALDAQPVVELGGVHVDGVGRVVAQDGLRLVHQLL
jgi:hypothetical protein